MSWAGYFLFLVYYTLFRWLDIWSKKIGYPGSTYSYMYWPTILSVIGYELVMGTIDGGGTGNVHTIGAVYFFIMLYLMVMNVTIVCSKMREWDSSFMSYSSLLQKKIVNGYLTIVWIYCLIGALL